MTATTRARDLVSLVICPCRSDADIAATRESASWAGDVIVLDGNGRDLHRANTDSTSWGAYNEWTLVLHAGDVLADDAPEHLWNLINANGHAWNRIAMDVLYRVGRDTLQSEAWSGAPRTCLFRTGTARFPRGLRAEPEFPDGPTGYEAGPEGPVVHALLAGDVRDLIAERLRDALAVATDEEIAALDLDAATAAIHESLARFFDPDVDGDFSRLPALVEAWAEAMRALVVWADADPRPPLDSFLALPVCIAEPPFTAASPAGTGATEIRRLGDEMHELFLKYQDLEARFHEVAHERDTMKASRSWRITAPLRGLKKP